MPLSIMNSLDSMGLYYFHDNGLIVGSVAFVNHECACEISYGFDWPLSIVRKSRISDSPLHCQLLSQYIYPGTLQKSIQTYHSS
jgi:hypothetical protein